MLIGVTIAVARGVILFNVVQLLAVAAFDENNNKDDFTAAAAAAAAAADIVETVRIHERAAYGTVVYRINTRPSIVNKNRRQLRVFITGSSDDFHRHFRLQTDITPPAIVVSEFPILSSPVGNIYSVELLAITSTSDTDKLDSAEYENSDRTSEQAVGRKRIDVVISRSNRYSPQFQSFNQYSGSLFGEIYRYAVPDTAIPLMTTRPTTVAGNDVITLTVVDYDDEDYNRDVSFRTSVRPRSKVSLSSKTDDEAILKVNRRTGEITTESGLRHAARVLHVDLIAANSLASPYLSSQINLTVYVCDVPEPQNVSVRVENVTSAVVCWNRPRFGLVSKYQLLLFRLTSQRSADEVTAGYVRQKHEPSSAQFEHTSTVYWIPSPSSFSNDARQACQNITLSTDDDKNRTKVLSSSFGTSSEYAVRLRPWTHHLTPGLSTVIRFSTNARVCRRHFPCVFAVADCTLSNTSAFSDDVIIQCAGPTASVGPEVTCNENNREDDECNYRWCNCDDFGFAKTMTSGYAKEHQSSATNSANCRRICRNRIRNRQQRRAAVNGDAERDCLNGGTPNRNSQAGSGGSVRCLCPKPFSGDRCQDTALIPPTAASLTRESTSPNSTPCGALMCRNGGVCKSVDDARTSGTLAAASEATSHRCECLVGFIGVQCEQIDPCAGSPCLNGGFCRYQSNPDVTYGEYKCECFDGFYGRNCSRFDPCSSGPCQNNGHCRNVTDTIYSCLCRTGFHGDHCELYSPCANSPCLHGGICNSIDGRFECDCEPGRFGRRCERVDPCRQRTASGDDPCGSHAVACHNFSDTSFKCICESGWTGSNCSTYNPCYSMPCLNGGTCEPATSLDFPRQKTSSLSSSFYDHSSSEDEDNYIRCRCLPGYHGDLCQLLDHCLSSPCLNGGTCVNSSSSTDVFRRRDGSVSTDDRSADRFRCICTSFYFGPLCETPGPCATADCRHGSTCIEITPSEFRCSCPPCRYGPACQHFNACCSAPCRHNGRCVPESGGRFSCRCPTGYRGADCRHFDPCASSPCQHGGRCTALSDETFRCSCTDRYYGDRCQDLDACHANPCRHAAAACVNVPPSSFRCQCPPGAYGRLCDGTDPCADRPCRNGGSCSIVEHSTTNSKMVPNTASMTSSDRSSFGVAKTDRKLPYRCDCVVGFGGVDCESIDPCHSSPCRHGGTCTPSLPMSTLMSTSPGGSTRNYSCKCDIEFEGPDCQYETPCNTHGKRCYNDGVCTRRHPVRRYGNGGAWYGSNEDTAGSSDDGAVAGYGGMYCKCPEGYSGSRCQDFDPCSTDNACVNGGTCQMMESGMAHCTCPVGFFGDHCELHRPCNVYVCKNNATCVHTLHSDICYCQPGFSGRHCEVDLDECLSNPCLNGGTCVDQPGKYDCLCREGFAGEICHRADTCPREVTLNAKGRFIWPATTHGSRATVVCPRNADEVATRTCGLLSSVADQQQHYPANAGELKQQQQQQQQKLARWDEPDFSLCLMEVHSAREATEALTPFKTQSLDDPYKLADAVSLLETILHFACEDSQIAMHMVDIIDRILDVDEHILHGSNCTRRLLRLMDEFLSTVNWLKDNVTFVANNIELDVRYITWVDHEHGATFVPKLLPTASISIPPEIFYREVASERLKFIYFRSSKLFPNSLGVNVQPVDDVISASVGPEAASDLKNCVRFVFPNNQMSRHSRCVYWEEEENTWSPYGIVTDSYRGGRTVCCSSHFSYFAVTSDPEVARVSFVQEDVDTTLATYCGLGFAVVSHAVVLLMYAFVRTLNTDRFGQIVIQLIGSSLAYNACLLAAYSRYRIDSAATCTVVAILSHFFTLSTFLWFIVAGHCLFTTQKNKENKDAACQSDSCGSNGGNQNAPVSSHSRKNNCRVLLRSLGFAWGLPILPIVITMAVDTRVYQRNVDSCLMAADNRYLFCSVYLLPTTVAIVTNLLLDVAAAVRFCYNRCCARFGSKSPSMMSSAGFTAGRVSGLFVFSVLSTLSWTLSVAAALPQYSDSVVRLQYWHCAAQSLSAFAALMAFGLLSPECRLACIGANGLFGRRQRRCLGVPDGSGVVSGVDDRPLTTDVGVRPPAAGADQPSSISTGNGTTLPKSAFVQEVVSHNNCSSVRTRRRPSATRMYTSVSGDEEETLAAWTTLPPTMRSRLRSSEEHLSSSLLPDCSGMASLDRYWATNHCQIRPERQMDGVGSELAFMDFRHGNGFGQHHSQRSRRLPGYGDVISGCEETDVALVHTSV